MAQMNMNNMVKICFLLIILSVKIGESLIPVDRYGHGSVLVDEGIYFFGGLSSNSLKVSATLDQVLYLDLSEPFDTANPPFKEIPDVSIPFGSAYGTTLLGPQKNTIYLFGGYMLDVNTDKDNFMSSLYTFNLETNEWDIPKANGIEPERRGGISGVINNETGKIYIFGGAANRKIGVQNFKSFNDMIIFDTVSSTWSKGSTINAPFPCFDYTATLLPNGIIVFIGGREEYIPNSPARDVDMSQLSLYDTKADMWSSMTTRGITLESRNAHSAVLTSDERIIIFGGRKGGDVVGSSIIRQLAVLDTKKVPYEWSIPLVSATILPPTLIFHSATLVGNYMFINFGNNSYPILNSEVNITHFYILDIRNFTWVSQFEPKQQTNTVDNKFGIIIGIVVGIVGVGAIAGFLGYKLYKYAGTNKNGL